MKWVKFLKSTHRVNVNNLLFYFWVPRHVNLVKNNFIFILISLYSDSIEVDTSDNSKEIPIEVDLVSTLLASRYICLSLVFKNPSSFTVTDKRYLLEDHLSRKTIQTRLPFHSLQLHEHLLLVLEPP